MKLKIPVDTTNTRHISRLRQDAKRLARQYDIPLNEAQRRTANAWGWENWETLVAVSQDKKRPTRGSSAAVHGLYAGEGRFYYPGPPLVREQVNLQDRAHWVFPWLPDDWDGQETVMENGKPAVFDAYVVPGTERVLHDVWLPWSEAVRVARLYPRRFTLEPETKTLHWQVRERDRFSDAELLAMGTRDEDGELVPYDPTRDIRPYGSAVCAIDAEYCAEGVNTDDGWLDLVWVNFPEGLLLPPVWIGIERPEPPAPPTPHRMPQLRIAAIDGETVNEDDADAYFDDEGFDDEIPFD